jgi:hypothetical protein
MYMANVKSSLENTFYYEKEGEKITVSDRIIL